MKSILSYILAALLVLPFHTLSYVNTVLHVADHGHDHDGDVDHDHMDHDAEDSSLASVQKQNFSHQHAPDQPVHSHDRDIWGLFANPGLYQQPDLVSLPAFVFLDPPIFHVGTSISDPFSGSLLRPPIA